MNKFITFAAFGIAAVTSVGIALADQGIPNLPAQPLVSMTAPGVVGQAYPVFGGAQRPVVAERFDTDRGSQSYPDFTPPSRIGQRGNIQIGAVQTGQSPTDLAMASKAGAPRG